MGAVKRAAMMAGVCVVCAAGAMHVSAQQRSNESARLSGDSAAAQHRVQASAMPGGDLGAQVNAADAQLGASAGTIVISKSGTATTPVKLSAKHDLRIDAATTWQAGITVTQSNHIMCAGQSAPLTITLADQSWFIGGTGVSDISADKCWVHTTNPGGKNYYFVGVRNGTKIRVTNCNSTDLPLVLTAALGQVDRLVPDKGENGMSGDIEVVGNTVTLPSPAWRHFQATGVLVVYTEGIHIAHNHFEHMNHGVQYWGGDAHGKGVTITSKRLAGQILIEENTCAHVWGACYWGSMGHDVTFQNNTADDCGDVCIDAEGSTKVTMAGNTVQDGHNGGLATFFFNEKVMITRNAVSSTNAKYPLLRTWNVSQSPDLNVDTEVFGNEFNCMDETGTCRIMFESTNGFSFLDNHLMNTVIRSLNYQKNVAITHNTFRFTRPGAAPLQPIFLSGQLPGGISRVVNNTVIVDPSWLAGGECVTTPGPARYLVSGNTCGKK